jgi:hypothetical protein
VTNVRPCLVLLALAAVLASAAALAAGTPPGAVPRWEYRVLSREQVLKLGQKDLEAGLNRLGDQGWDLVSADREYIFKRPRVVYGLSAADLKALKDEIALRESDVNDLKERVAWTQRMVRKGFRSTGQLRDEQRVLQEAELALEGARRQLQILPPPAKDPKAPK